MVVLDPVSDMIIRIKNALARQKTEVDIPASKMLTEIARLLKEEGYIANYSIVEDGRQGILRVDLKYTPEGSSVITDLKRISKSSRRIYVGLKEVPKVIEGLGRAFISTSRGLMTDKECRKNRLGGEIVLYVW